MTNNSNNNPKDFVTIVVLNDGETFTDISGCSICIVPRKQYEETVNSGGDARDFKPIAEIALDNLVPPYEDIDDEILDDEEGN